jgi:hypothetical protein
MNLGVDISTIPADFDKMLASNIGPGDIWIDNTTTKGIGSVTLNLKNNFVVKSNTGNVDISSGADSGDPADTLAHGLLTNSTNSGNILVKAQNSMSHVSPSIGIGKLASELGPAEALINKTHLKNFGDILNKQRLNDMIKMATTLTTAGVPNAHTALAMITAFGVADIGAIGIPGGSSIVKAIT